jgi:hypothetical protein
MGKARKKWWSLPARGHWVRKVQTKLERTLKGRLRGKVVQDWRFESKG